MLLALHVFPLFMYTVIYLSPIDAHHVMGFVNLTYIVRCPCLRLCVMLKLPKRYLDDSRYVTARNAISFFVEFVLDSIYFI